MLTLLPHLDAPAGEQMALDEALLLGLCGERAVRTYTFEPPAWSLGFFQTLGQVPAAAAALARGEPVVRRATGGGAIHHHRELTYSLAAPLDQGLFRGPIAGSYERLHAAVARAIRSALGSALAEGTLTRRDLAPSWSAALTTHAGATPSAADLEAALPLPLRRETRLASDQAGTGLCFHDSSPLDLIAAGPDGAPAKLVGSAQRRLGGRVLHHGSIKLAPDPDEPGVASLCTPEAWQGLCEHLTRALEGELVLALGSARGSPDLQRSPVPPAAAQWVERRRALFSSRALLAREPAALEALRRQRPALGAD